MKSIAFYLSAIGLLGSFLTGCNTIETPYPKALGQLTAEEAAVLDSIETRNGLETPVQKVLLEDYTGHTCGNCPGAAVLARSQQKQYGDRLVVVAVHANYFAKYNKAPYTTNFTTPEGEEWFTSFGFMSNPNGMINRTKSGATNAFVQGVSAWPGAIAKEMEKAPRIGMNLTTQYIPETRKVNIKVRAEYLTSLQGRYNLGIVITEDSIISYQKNYGAAAGGDPAYPVGDVSNYVHPHAMRLAVTGTWGVLNRTSPAAGDVKEAYYTATLDNAWKPGKCSVVAFIFDEATREILQVEEVHLEE